MTPGGLLTTIAGAALAITLVGGAPTLTNVLAQEATPPATEAPAEGERGQKVDFEAQRAEAYTDFVAALAAELGNDEAAVDAAIRAALSQQVDVHEAAGEIDLEQAAAIRAVIEVTDAPLFLGFGGRHEMHGFDGHHGGRPGGDHGKFDGRGPRGQEGERGEDRTGADEAPAALPDADDAADQAAPASEAPAMEPVL
jgi:hypothetical protein